MNNKKSRLFLWIGLALFAISVIAVIASIIASYYEIKADFPDDDIRVMNEFGFGLFIASLLVFPFLGSELSCIRSIYKLLKYKTHGCVKVCYIVSSLLAFLAVVFFCLSSFGWIQFVQEGGHNRTAEVLLFILWPVLIASFILGSIPVKHADGCNKSNQ